MSSKTHTPIKKVKKSPASVKMSDPAEDPGSTNPLLSVEMTERPPIATPIILTEIFDDIALRKCLLSPAVSDEVKATLRAYRLASKKVTKDGTRRVVSVAYSFAKAHKDTKLGRLYNKPNGAQSMKRNVRKALFAHLYHDLDLVAAQPTLLQNIAHKKEWPCPALDAYLSRREAVLRECQTWYTDCTVTRDQAKELFNVALFLGGEETWRTQNAISSTQKPFPFAVEFGKEMKALAKLAVVEFVDIRTEVNTRDKPKRKKDDIGFDSQKAVMAYVLHTAENDCLMSANQLLVETGFGGFSTPIFDGGLVSRREGVDRFPTEVLSAMNARCKEDTGYSVKWIEKDWSVDNELDLDDIDLTVVDPSAEGTGLIDDLYAARVFVDILGNSIKRDGETLLLFNPKTGMWGDARGELLPSVHRNADKLVFVETTEKGTKIHNYGGDATKMDKMLKMLDSTALVPDTRFIERNGDTGKHKMLFANGIYDFNTREFSDEFNPEIVFFARLDRDFPARDEALIARVRKMLFEDPFVSREDPTNEMGEFYLNAWTYALVGEYRQKKFYICVGDSNSGKGVVTEAIKAAFAGYAVDYDANNLKSNSRLGTDEAKKYMWLLDKRCARAMIANEVKMDSPFDANIIKPMSGGGDTIEMRTHHAAPVRYTWRVVPFVLCNDSPPITPVDSGIRTRIRHIKYRKTFVETDDPRTLTENQLLADPDAKNRFKEDPAWQNALFWVIADQWTKIKDAIYHDPECVKQETREWLGDPKSQTIAAILGQDFKITKLESDCVPFATLKAILAEAGMSGFSDTKLGKELSALGLRQENRRYEGKVQSCRVGIRALTPEELDALDSRE